MFALMKKTLKAPEWQRLMHDSSVSIPEILHKLMAYVRSIYSYRYMAHNDCYTSGLDPALLL